MGWFSNATSWVSDRAEAASTNINRAVESVSSAVSSTVHAVTHPAETIQAVGNAIDSAIDSAVEAGSNAIDAVGGALESAGEGIQYAWEHKGEIAQSIGEGLATAGNAVGEFTYRMATDPGRTLALAGQGLTNAVIATGGSIVDLAGMAGGAIIKTAWDYNPATLLVNGAANFVGLDSPIGSIGFEYGDLLDINVTDWAIEHTQFIEPKDDYERAMLYGTQAIGEIGSFIALTAVTGGAYAGLRGAAGAARTARIATAAMEWGRAVMPLTRGAILVEGALGTVMFTGNMTQSKVEERVTQALIDDLGLDAETVASMTRSEKMDALQTISDQQLAEAEDVLSSQLTDTFGVAAADVDQLSLQQMQTLVTIKTAEYNQTYGEILVEAGMDATEVAQMSLDEKLEASLEIALRLYDDPASPQQPAQYAENDLDTDVPLNGAFTDAAPRPRPQPGVHFTAASALDTTDPVEPTPSQERKLVLS